MDSPDRVYGTLACLADLGERSIHPAGPPVPLDDRLPDSLARSLASGVLADLRPPRLVLVREPHQLRIERAHQPLAFGAWLVELAEEDRHVASDDDRTPARLDDDHLRASRVAWCRDEPEPRQQLEFAVHGDVLHAGRVDPLADRVIVPAACVVELQALDIGRPAGEEMVAAAVVEVEMGVDDDVDAGTSKSACVLKGIGRGSRSATAGCSAVKPVSTSTRASGWSMTCT